jgi:hypothetical protein
LPRSNEGITDSENLAIARALCALFGADLDDARRVIPDVVEHAGKMRITDGGDLFHAAELVKTRTDSRDASFVRVRAILCCSDLHAH